MTSALVFDLARYRARCAKNSELVGAWAYHCDGLPVVNWFVVDSHGCPHMVSATWCRGIDEGKEVSAQ